MKKWTPIVLSFLLHGIIIFFIAKNKLAVPSNPTTSSPLNAVLYFPPPAQPEMPEDTVSVVDDALPKIENTPLVVNEPKPETQKTLPAFEEKLKSEPIQQTEIPSENKIAETSTPSLAKPKLSISDVTRNALSVLQSQSFESIYQQEKAEFDNQDARIIENAPRYTQEQLENRRSPQPVDIDCGNKGKKALAIVSTLGGGRLKCRQNNNEQVNSYINKHLNKETQQRRIDDKFDQKAK